MLTCGDFVAGVGNAYADKILWHARLYPSRKRTGLTPDEVDRLYDGLRACLLAATDKVCAEMVRPAGADIHLKP